MFLLRGLVAREDLVAMRWLRTNIASIALGLVFAAGLALLLYPWAASTFNAWREGQLIENYQTQTEKISKSDADAWIARARSYNESLSGKGVPDAFAIHSATDNQNYRQQLAFRDDGVMGYISIPAINVNLPIYHGTGKKVLQKGAGHLQGSALPVGGKGTHAVISAHRGLPSASMFTDLDLLQAGDRFYITVLGRKLAYEVDKIEEVDPDETRSLAVEEDKDLVTLVTCTPYGVNTKRLLVRGHRVAYSRKTEAADAEGARGGIFTQYGIWALGGFSVVVLFATFAWWRTHEGERAGSRSAKVARSCRHDRRRV